MRTQHLIYREDNILFVTLIGAFDQDALALCHQELLPHVQALRDKPFAVLTDITDFEGATPEAFKAGNTFNQWLNELGFVAKAIVTTSQLMVSIAHQNSPALKQQNFKTFDSKHDAIDWLKQQLSYGTNGSIEVSQ